MNNTDISTKTPWKERLRESLPLFGHRNWIVVTDSAYPLQSNPGIETLLAAGDQIEVARTVLTEIASHKHIQAHIHMDRELQFLAEHDVPGVTEFRRQLNQLFQHNQRSEALHEQILARLDRSATLFRILIVKTESQIPYTSIFFELECGYRSAAAEERIRRGIGGAVGLHSSK
jgi:hypothetical protein